MLIYAILLIVCYDKITEGTVANGCANEILRTQSRSETFSVITPRNYSAKLLREITPRNYFRKNPYKVSSKKCNLGS
jgi:hypothetical protein